MKNIKSLPEPELIRIVRKVSDRAASYNRLDELSILSARDVEGEVWLELQKSPMSEFSESDLNRVASRVGKKVQRSFPKRSAMQDWEERS